MCIIRYYFIFINLLTLVLYGIDKLLAVYHMRRISERTLLLSSVLGGCFFAYIGMILFRHKTKKIKFHFVNVGMIIIYLLFFIEYFK